VTRLSFTEEERAAKDRVASYMEEAGLFVYEDAAGNLFGRREGRGPEAPAVLVGSHVDSVYSGGNFDGPLGVLAGIEVLQTMEEQKVETEHPIEVVAFTDEEGVRFSFGWSVAGRSRAGSPPTTCTTARTEKASPSRRLCAPAGSTLSASEKRLVSKAP
jgi:allantoate deiminase